MGVKRKPKRRQPFWGPLKKQLEEERHAEMGCVIVKGALLGGKERFIAEAEEQGFCHCVPDLDAATDELARKLILNKLGAVVERGF